MSEPTHLHYGGTLPMNCPRCGERRVVYYFDGAEGFPARVECEACDWHGDEAVSESDHDDT